MPNVSAWVRALALLAIAPSAYALTTPLTGATLFPSSGPPLQLPFPAGTHVRVIAGYGPSAGSSLHDGITDPTHGNDYYALDLNYDGLSDGGRGMPIVAALPGTVVRAGWSSAGWANFGQRIILRHDLGDGHVYYSQYAHLNAIATDIVEGATVSQGQVLGELGQSCQGALSCASFSTPHVHFSIHRDSSIGGTGTGGSYGGNAVVPEPLDGAEDLLPGRVIVSMNAGTPVCGDGYCSGDETHASCAGDCPICESIPPAGRAVDESEICFTRGGNPAYWNDETDGWESTLIWTHATDAAAADNYGVWDLAFDEAGRYLVEAYTDATWAQSRQARYSIAHAGTTSDATLDQSAADGWQSLGEHAFAAGGGQSVRLDDNTGEAFSLRRQLVFDAIRLTRTDPIADADAGPPPPIVDAGASDAGASDASASDAGPPVTIASGCSCRAAPSDRAPLWLVALAFVLAIGARRSRTRAH